MLIPDLCRSAKSLSLISGLNTVNFIHSLTSVGLIIELLLCLDVFGLDSAKALLEKLARKTCQYYELGEQIWVLQGDGWLFYFQSSF